MDAFDSRFEKALRERIGKMLKDRSAAILEGRCKSHDEYLGQCQSVQVLHDVMSWMEDIRHDLVQEATGRTEAHNPVLRGHNASVSRGSRS
jgi:hypothetical protein